MTALEPLSDTKAVATGRAANGLGEVKEVDTGTVGGAGEGSTTKYGETHKKALEVESSLVSCHEPEYRSEDRR